MRDQVIRFLLPDAEQRFGRESDEYRWFRNELMAQNDEQVLNDLKVILEDHGWLGVNKVGELANQAIWLVIQHAPLDVQLKYLPQLETSVQEGESKAEYLAFLTDRVRMRQGKDQVYGTQSLWDHELGKNVIYPVENWEEVNEMRAKVGLNSIEDYANNNGFVIKNEL